MPDTTTTLPVAPVPDTTINPIGADIAKVFNSVVTAVAGTIGGQPFDILEWLHVLSDTLWLAGDLVTKYGVTPAGFQELVAQFETFAQTNIVDQMFAAGGPIAGTVSWIEKHLAGPQIVAVIKDALTKHKAAIVPAVPATPSPATPTPGHP